MKVNNIILLEDNQKYLLLDETIYEDKKYFYAVKVTDDTLQPTEKYKFLEQKQDIENVYVSEVKDEEIISALLVIFTNSLGLQIENLEN